MAKVRISFMVEVDPISNAVDLTAKLDDQFADEVTLAWGRKAMQLVNQYTKSPVEPINADLAMIDNGTVLIISNQEDEYDDDGGEWDDDDFDPVIIAAGDPMKLYISLNTCGNEHLIGGFATPSFAMANTVADGLKVIGNNVSA